MKTLFRSVQTTLQMIISGHIQREDLASGLFILDCSRADAMSFAAVRERIASWCDTCVVQDEELDLVSLLVDAHEQLIDAILEAESDARIIWSKTGLEITYDQVDDLLAANGEPCTTYNDCKHFYIDCLALDESLRNVLIWPGFAFVDAME